jgi:hypothetical protein
MTTSVFRDEDGVVHYVIFDVPETVCGISRISRAAIDKGKTLSVYSTRTGLGTIPLPDVTCLQCITEATDPNGA